MENFQDDNKEIILTEQDDNSAHVRKTRVTDIDVEIGNRLAEFRNKFNITQTELGNAIGVTFQQIQKYEKGTNRIHAEVLFRIANTFDIDVAEFFPVNNEDGSKANTNIGEIPYDDKQSLALVKAYLEVTDHNVRKKIINLITSIVESENKIDV
jgi:transcriptional regulator with XRE-family HTH domain